MLGRVFFRSKDSHVVFCPNEQRSFRPFMCLGSTGNHIGGSSEVRVIQSCWLLLLFLLLLLLLFLLFLTSSIVISNMLTTCLRSSSATCWQAAPSSPPPPATTPLSLPQPLPPHQQQGHRKSRISTVTTEVNNSYQQCRHLKWTTTSTTQTRTAWADDDDVELNVLGCRVDIIVRDKLWPMRVHGSVLLYVHRNRKAH